jgi:hypothetical protein
MSVSSHSSDDSKRYLRLVECSGDTRLPNPPRSQRLGTSRYGGTHERDHTADHDH